MKKNLTVSMLLAVFVSFIRAEVLPEITNIVVIVTDDHALKVAGTYGNERVRTPSIDRLSEQGITFTTTYCNSPICSASRQSMLTGKYPHATGVNLLFTPFPDEGNTTIAEHLKETGYKTAIIGKQHWNNSFWYSLYEGGPPNHGFDHIVDKGQYRRYLEGVEQKDFQIETYNRQEALKDDAERINCRVLPHAVEDKNSLGVYLTNQAIDFVEENKKEPFFLWLSYYEPHAPFYFPVEFAGKYKAEDMVLPQTSPEDDQWVPLRFKNLTDLQRKGVIASYYTCVEYMDRNIGMFVDALDEMGMSENTLVIYLSDNGYLLNEHKRFEKHTMWEEAVRQPMIIRFGDHYRAGSREDALIEYVDVVPTLLDLVDAEPISEVQGRSFVNVINDEEDDFRELVFSEYLQDNLAMIRDERWKYIFTTGSRELGIGYRTGNGPRGIVHRLYDLQEDPLELKDVSEQYPNELNRLQNAMLQRFMETHPDAKNCPDQLTLIGKLVWFCEPRDIGTDQTTIDHPVIVSQR